MRAVVRLCVLGVFLGLLVTSCPGHGTPPTTHSPTTPKGSPAWP